ILYDRSGNQDEAVRWYEQALLAAQGTGDRRSAAKAEASIGIALFVRAKDEARGHLEAALPVLTELGDSFRQAEILYRLGIHDQDLGRFDEAQGFYRQALQAAELGNSQLVPYILNGLGTIALTRGETQEALERYRRAQDLAVEPDQRQAQAAALAGLGTIDRRQGRPQEALRNLNAALEINRKIELPLYEGRTLTLLGAVYLDLGEIAKAREDFEEAIHVFRAAQENGWLARALGVLGNADLSVGRAQDALEIYREMLTVSETAKLKLQKAAALHGIGAAQRWLGRPAEAIQSLEQALSYRQGKDRLGEALTRQELGKSYLALGDQGRAESSLREAQRIADAVGAFLPQTGVHYDLALLERQKGDVQAAIAEIEQAVKILETVRSDISDDRLRTSFFASRRSYYDLYVDLLMELDRRSPGQGYADRALAASEQGRARGLLDLLKRLELTRGISAELRHRETEATARLSQIQAQLVEESLEKSRPEVLADLRSRLQEAEAEQQAIEQRIKAESPLYYEVRYPSLLQRGEIQSLLDPDTALLEYSLGDEAAYLFVVTRDGGLTAHRLALSRSTIASEAEKLRKTFESPGELGYAYRSAAYRLYQGLVAPAEADFRGKRRLLIAADGPLSHLPFDALLTGLAQDNASLPNLYLVNRYTTSYIPSASVLSSLSRQRSAARSEPSPRFLAFAPAYGKAAVREASNEVRSGAADGAEPPALEGAEAEVEAIAERYPGKAKLFLGADASLENVRKNPLVSDCIHFAGHGLLDEEHPENSGLLLEGGTLRVADIFNLELTAGLVVLSACETAGKEVNGEGLVGLTRAFLYAGSPSVVVTLWRVADRKTPDLMLRFYAGLDENGDKAEALRQAKLGLIQNRGLRAHPYYWAPFILVGQPR
ncbi:MAG TPA: CHAT domain-containing tetratricopeptide repeat protein, partial [Thermoanaerobaculia bacterium]